MGNYVPACWWDSVAWDSVAAAGPATLALPHRFITGPVSLVQPVLALALLSATACVSLWPTTHAHVPAPTADVRSCATTQARELGYHVSPDTTHGSVTAEKTLPFSQNGPDVTVYSIKNMLAVSLQPEASVRGSTMSVTAQTISVQQSRRGMADVPVTASGQVRADADTLLARCRHAGASTSLPSG